MADNSVSFSPFAGARAKFVLLGAPGLLGFQIVSSVRSLKHFEYVNIAPVHKRGGDLPGVSGSFDSGRTLHEIRHWFFGRKRNRGFLLQGCPGTVQHALVLDEWLDARDETLSGCLWLDLGFDEAMGHAACRIVCPEFHTTVYDISSGPVVCRVCGEPMQSDRERAEGEVRVWFADRAATTESVAEYYHDRGQLFRFNAATTRFDDVSRVAQAVSVDR